MFGDKIINYVKHTPENTNPAVLATLLGDLNKQSDWNQNDDTQLDYVKNRPFYTGDPVETVLVEESTVSFTKNPFGDLYSGEFKPTFSATVGETYKVSWDGTIYECVGTDTRVGVALGNLSIIDEFGADTGEPFFFGRAIFVTKDTSAFHTISITANIAQVTKIDEKYIPELPYMDKSNPTGTGAFSLNRNAESVVGANSFAEGTNTTASGANSHAEGRDTTASSLNSHAEGEYTTASGANSHAEGTDTTASGMHSHAEGNNTTASNFDSHAEGYNTTASGMHSHAEGASTTASNLNSHAEGGSTKASSENQHVQGKYNIEDSSGTYAHIVGNGTSDTARSNAHTLDWSGNAWYAGTVEGVAFVLPSSTEGSTKKFKITVDDSGTISATEVK